MYSRDGNGTATPHNLYAPYYKQWLPGTAADDVNPRASGTDWSHQNNFPFVPVTLYDNWDAYSLRLPADRGHRVQPARGVPGGASSDEPRTTPVDDPAEVNGSVRRVAVATDEHGEAQVEYEPYAGGFYYDNVGAIINDNRGCDLQDVDVLGTSAITATAKYPGQPVDFSNTVSATLTKTVGNEFDKSMSYYPKGAGTANANARILVAHGQDVDGTPFARRARLLLRGRRGGLRTACSPAPPGRRPRGSRSTRTRRRPRRASTRTCAARSWTRTATPPWRCSTPIRSRSTSSPSTSTRACCAIATSSSARRARATRPRRRTRVASRATPPAEQTRAPSAPSKQQVVKTAGPSLVPAVTTARPASISKARIKKTKKGRFLMVRVTSDKDSATLSVRLVAKKTGKVYKKVSKSIATNRTVKVMKLPKRARTARVALSS